MKPNISKLLLAGMAMLLMATGTGCMVVEDFIGDFSGHGRPVTGNWNSSGNWLDAVPGGEADTGCKTCRGEHSGNHGHMAKVPPQPEAAPATVKFHPVPTRPVFAPQPAPMIAEKGPAPGRTTHTSPTSRTTTQPKVYGVPADMPAELVRSLPPGSVISDPLPPQPLPATEPAAKQITTAPAESKPSSTEQAAASNGPMLVQPAVATQPAELPVESKTAVPASAWRPVVRGSYR